MFCHCGVSTRPMFTLLTRISSLPSSIDSALDRLRHEARFTDDARNAGSGYLAYTALMLITRGALLPRKCGSDALVQRICENSFTSMSACQSSSVRVANWPGRGPPALLTR